MEAALKALCKELPDLTWRKLEGLDLEVSDARQHYIKLKQWGEGD